MDAPTITLGEHTAQLQPPGALAALALSRDQAVLADDAVVVALGAAALFICWPADTAWPSRPRPRAWRVGQKMEALGHQVFDALVASGVSIPAAIEAGAAAYGWALQGLLSEEEVQAAENFSEAPAG
jgi:hypothetical protein